MKVRQVVVTLASCGALLFPAAGTAAATGTVPSDPAVDSAAAAGSAVCSAEPFQNDARLGPNTLPDSGPVGDQLPGYQRTGGMTPQAFLARFWDPTANSGQGDWKYPPANGYVTTADGTAVEWRQPLKVGQDIDRYGGESGGFLAPEGMAYAKRSIPPQRLDGTPAAGCNYHDYRVLKPFTVDAGPIAAWFGQPGGGLQYQLDGTLVPGAPNPLNVAWLVANGYLQHVV